jgi:pyruvate kinase
MSRARTKQVCTIGPASVEKIPALVAAGMDVARVNFSHGTPEEHRAYVHAVRAAAHSARRSVAVMADLPGPKLRLGGLVTDQARLETGTLFVLREDDGTPGDATGAAVSRPDVTRRLQPGDRVLLADGAAELRVVSVDGSRVTTEVVNGGLVRTRGGVNVPSERLPHDGLTAEDRAAVPRALELRADLIAQSFVRTPEDVRALRALLPSDGPRLVVKVETRSAVDGFDEIAALADGVMVARGDLGVDLPFEDVPLVQKDLIRRASEADRFTVVATQMLESMTFASRPTRAEASDVANAVLDGADAVMLSAETAIGAYPVEALQAMERICAVVEDRADFVGGDEDKVDNASGIVLAAAAVSGYIDAEAIWCFTRTGRTAEMLSMTRPAIPIVAFTLSPVVARRLAVRRAVTPVVLSGQAKSGTLIERMEQAWRWQRNGRDVSSVLLVTTSQNAQGISRLEIHALTTPVSRAIVPQQGRRDASCGDRRSRPRREPGETARGAPDQAATAAPEVPTTEPAGPEAQPRDAESPGAETADSQPAGAVPQPAADQTELRDSA